ncbi:MAG TPA: hypothetical protein PL110_02230 [Candidatus Eremiobacteraeota bacterium]|nr:MAG: hypothetical protein BWY64_03389 [bacterium ADurb.Bin363]HPZ06906.1 hypothetical protein [Candidatus Eremiobacteraeota bacterium]
MKINRTDIKNTEQLLKSQKKPDDKGLEQKDQVILSGEKGGGLNLIVGAYTGRLNPQIPPGDRYNLVPIGLEIQKGVGISLDGESIIVTRPPESGKVSITGHLQPGEGEPVPESGILYPQRDFQVVSDEKATTIDGFYDWQDYTITDKDGERKIDCKDDDNGRFDYQVKQEGNKTFVTGEKAVQNFTITKEGNKTYVKGYDDNLSYTITTEGNVTKVKGNIPERQFTITDNGKEWAIDGHMAYQDFKVTKDPHQVVIKGYYPQQKYVIDFKAI